jgi:hypothetical protein
MRTSFALACAFAVSAGSVGAPPAFHEAVAGDEPVLWYQFNEPEGSLEAVNYGSLGDPFNGVFTNGVGLEAGSLQGDAAACFTAAEQQYVESKSVAPQALTGNPSFSAEAVVRIFDAAQSPNYAPFLHWGTGATGTEVYFSMWHSSGDRAFAGFYNGGRRMVDTFAKGTWVHLVWVRDSGGGINDDQTGTTLYVNGEPVETEHDDVLCCTFVPNVSSTTFRVQKARDYTRYFSGDLDEVALYDRLLTPEEVAAHYEALVAGEGGGTVCYADINGDGVLDLFDFLTFVNRFNAGNASADCIPSACEPSLDLFDFLCFVNQFNAGC